MRPAALALSFVAGVLAAGCASSPETRICWSQPRVVRELYCRIEAPETRGAGDSVPVRVTLRNVSEKTTFHVLVAILPGGRRAGSLLIRDGARLLSDQGPPVSYGGNLRDYRTIAPGEEMSDATDLRLAYPDLGRPGTYEIIFRPYVHELYMGARIDPERRPSTRTHALIPCNIATISITR